MNDPASQWDSPLDKQMATDTTAFFRANASADEKIAELAALRTRLDNATVAEWKPLAAGITLMVERYYADAADTSQEAAITNLAGLLRHASAFAAALCHEVEHYAAEARDAKDEARALREQLAGMSAEASLLRSALKNLGVEVSDHAHLPGVFAPTCAACINQAADEAARRGHGIESLNL